MPSVLIIDDYVPNADSFAKLLSLEGFETATEYTGTGGLQAAFEGAFDVILVDLRLPDLSGIEVVGELRKRAVPARTSSSRCFRTWRRRSRRRAPAPMDMSRACSFGMSL
jgi:CheY-like chemotaxis protein